MFQENPKEWERGGVGGGISDIWSLGHNLFLGFININKKKYFLNLYCKIWCVVCVCGGGGGGPGALRLPLDPPLCLKVLNTDNFNAYFKGEIQQDQHKFS